MVARILLVIHVLVAVAIVGLVLLQQGRGADMGAAFGGGSQTLFGARGAANFLTRVTTVLATVFFLTSGSLAYIYSKRDVPSSVTVKQQTAPEQNKTETEPTANSKPEPAPASNGASGTAGTGEVPQAPGTGAPETSSGKVPQAPASEPAPK